MTLKQARLLEDVLHDAITGWNTKVTFPATISEMIDARIEYGERILTQHKGYNAPFVESLKDEVFTLRFLKSLFECV